MEETEKYFPDTVRALTELNAALHTLDGKVDTSVAQKIAADTSLSVLKNALKDKATEIDEIIKTLNGAIS
jgi:predicted transcriptional regulator